MRLALERRLAKLEGPRAGLVVVWFGCEPGEKPVSVAVNEAQGITVHFGFELGEIETVPGLPRAEVSPKGAMVGI